MNKNKGKKIGIAGNHKTTIDLANGLIKAGYSISCIVNMTNDLNGDIAGYVNLGSFAKKRKIKIIRPKAYSLNTEADKKMIKSLSLDMLVVFGWQRLIPQWLLSNLSVGAFGVHGSWKQLPYGRGRSVGIWAIILGKDKILSNLFKYDANADSGDIVDTLKYKITPWDTVSTLHHKDQLACQQMLLKHLPNILEKKVVYRSQSRKTKEVFFPKRVLKDGVIDWSWSTKNIHNLIKAITRPYPGAFTFYKNKKIMLWQAVPFDLFPEFKNKRNGDVLTCFEDDTFVVKTGDSSILITEYESDSWVPKEGDRLISFQNKSFKKLQKENII